MVIPRQLVLAGDSFLLYDEASVRLDGDLCTTFLVDLKRGERGLASLRVDIILECLAWGEHRQIEGECQRLLQSIEACDVPFPIHRFAGKDDVAPRIAVDEACFLPCRGQLTQEIHLELRQFCQVIWLHSYALNGGLHDDA